MSEKTTPEQDQIAPSTLATSASPLMLQQASPAYVHGCLRRVRELQVGLKCCRSNLLGMGLTSFVHGWEALQTHLTEVEEVLVEELAQRFSSPTTTAEQQDT